METKSFPTNENNYRELCDQLKETLREKDSEIELLKKLKVAMEAELKQAQEVQFRMEEELNIARNIQQEMMPKGYPAFPERKEINIYGRLLPAREVGGDFYDYYWLDNNRLAMVVGDVSGKGAPASMLMAVCKALLKSKAKETISPAAIVTFVNKEMAKENHNYMFVTLFVGVIDVSVGQLTYTNAGHCQTLIRRTNMQIETLKVLHGPVVAAMEGIQYGETVVDIAAGDIIFAYSDGITEAHNQQGELFSEKRLEQSIVKQDYKEVKALVEQVMTDILFFERGAEQFDDITALCLAYNGVS